MPADTIVLIHGLWMTPRSWEQWAERHRVRGHRVLAPAWPGPGRMLFQAAFANVSPRAASRAAA